jgi:hypothetical protein
MACPSSGTQLILSKIYNELVDNDYSSGTSHTNTNMSLTNMSTGGNPPNEPINTANNPSSNRPNGSAPHEMSEFYDYDHDAVKSDIRSKDIIETIGYSELNIPIYIFNYKDNKNKKYSGTTAQDLLKLGFKDSVTIADDGYYRVDYDKIDVDFKRL